MERLSIDDDDEVAARWLSTLEETKRMAARHAADVAAAAAAQRGDDAWVDVAGGDALATKQPSSTSTSSAAASKTSTSTTGVPRDSGDAWRQEEWHIAFVVLVREGNAVRCLFQKLPSNRRSSRLFLPL